MKVEILYFSGCPNHFSAVGRVRDALEQEGVAAELVELEVIDMATAHRVGFLGSPSIRVNGQDVERAARASQASGLACRTYSYQGQRAGVPPLEWICAALREARENAFECGPLNDSLH